MNKKIIENLKIMRLIIAVFMVFVPIFKIMYIDSEILVSINLTLVMTILISIFVFLLGLQNKLEKKQELVANFLMLMSILMFIGTILGFVT